MTVKAVKPKGFFSFFKSSTYEVTAAVEERESFTASMNSVGGRVKPRENINLTADEEIVITQPVREEIKKDENKKEDLLFKAKFEENSNKKESNTSEYTFTTEKEFKERLDNLSELLEQKLSGNTQDDMLNSSTSEEMTFVRMVYNMLLDNEVNEKYVNQIVEEVEKFIRPGNNVDMILPNIYQKLVLKFGQPKTIELGSKKPNIIFFIGPTGVGKTTTIAKIASKYKVEYNCKVAFITADTYRIAATEQLRVYANILDAPMSIVYSVDEINDEIEKFEDYDLIFVDTAGFSHKNQQQKSDTKRLLDGVNEGYHKEIYLVLSATTKYRDLMEIVDIYDEISDYKLIFTKLDETSSYGNLLNIRLYADAELSYVTTGQSVPDDIEVFDTQKIVKQLLGGK
jgi:flagellar biosynthesis protein FlhF